MREKADTFQHGREVLPGYEVIALLSHGRRIDTYDVFSTERDCRCIVKILRNDRLKDAHAREAVIQEGTLLRHLTHPHLVRGYDVVLEPVPAMVLETLDGATLGALIEENTLGVSDSAALGLQLVSVLGYLHGQGWLHLDVKPSNIVVESARATLLDLSLVARPGNGRPGAGTRGYLSPEQATGQNLSPASDVWGLAVTLVESLTGQLPFGDEATWDSGRRLPLVHRRAVRAPRLAPGLPLAYGELLRRCLDQSPDARPSLTEVRHHLRGLVDADTDRPRNETRAETPE